MPGVCRGGDVEASIWLVHYCMNDRDFTVKSTVYLLVYPEKRLSKRTVVMFTDLPLSLYKSSRERMKQNAQEFSLIN